jgi:hypothetical protein
MMYAKWHSILRARLRSRPVISVSTFTRIQFPVHYRGPQ